MLDSLPPVDGDPPAIEVLVIDDLQQNPQWESQLGWSGLGILRVLWLQQSVSLGGGKG
jgi:hypothetical protein